MPARLIGHRRYRLAVLASGVVLLASTAASAQQAAPDSAQPAQRSLENGEMLRGQEKATHLTLTYNSDLNASIDGGSRRGAAYLQRIGLIGDVDLQRLVGWHGASAHASIHLINGTGLSDRVGTLLTVSGLEAESAARLFNLWVEQKIGRHVTLRAGQFTAGQEFAVSPTAALFVNSTFGWPASFATDLPSGGPAYPLAAPGLRLAAGLPRTLTVKVAVFAGDPAGPGSGDPQRRDVHGFNSFGLQGKPLLIAEVSRSAAGNDPAWTLTVGGWVHTGSFDDLARDVAGGSLGAATPAAPLRHGDDSAIYAMADARLWRSGTRALHGFVRVSASPTDRNAIDRYLDAGLSLSAPLRSRPNDIVGIGVAVAHISSRLRAVIGERAQAAGYLPDFPSFEGVIEASWQVSVGARVYVQPNVQIILHPAAALVAGDTAFPSPKRAIVLGLRTSVRL